MAPRAGAVDFDEPSASFEWKLSRAMSGSLLPGVAEKLRPYVYRLIDPRDRHTFYVGKGNGDRLFRHARDELIATDKASVLDDKLSVIRGIRQAGLKVEHAVHRHGMDETTAHEVESALIDAYPSLTNSILGAGIDRGPATTAELNGRFAPTVIEFRHEVVLVRASKAMIHERGCVYEAARKRWQLKPDRANSARYVLAIQKGCGICLEAYDDCAWTDCPDEPKKSEFTGRKAEDAGGVYVGQIIPDQLKYFVSATYAGPRD